METRKIIVASLIVSILVSVCIDDVDGRRGSGGSRSSGGFRGSGSSRGSRTKSRPTSSNRNRYQNYQLSGRSLGSSSYTSSTWRAAAVGGVIFGGIWYTSRYPRRQKLPPICTNNYEFRPGNESTKVIGPFICPKMTDNDTFIYCCGPSKREYCCNKEMAQEFYGSQRHSGGLSATGFIIIGVVILGAIAGFVFCCKKRQQTKAYFGKVIKRDKHQPPDEQSAQMMHPMYPPSAPMGAGPDIPLQNGSQPMPPMGQPPAYGTADSYGMGPTPYGPPMPQPELGFGGVPATAPYPTGPTAPYGPGAPYPPPGAPPYPTDPNYTKA